MGRTFTPHVRNPALEAAIIAAPDDPTPRSIYSDWLQEQGDPIGEWAAMRAVLEARPDDLVLRGAAIEYQGDHRADLFGDGVPAIWRAYVGWRGGFVDELRIQRDERTTLASIEALFAQPIVQFVRHIAIGQLAIPIQTVIDALVAAELPLLEELVVYDAIVEGNSIEVDAIAELPLRRLSLSNVVVKSPMPALRELVLLISVGNDISWIAEACPNLEKLTVLTSARAAAPELPDVEVVRYELMDVYGMPADVEHNPLEDLVRAGDRATVRLVPAAGAPVYNLGTTFLRTNLTDARLFLDLAATLPWQEDIASMINAAIAHEHAGDAVRAELLAREGLLSRPDNEGLYEILIDALRQQRRYEDAFRLFPRARAAIRASRDLDGQHRDRACLLDLVLTCILAGKPREAIALVDELREAVDDRHHAALAIMYLQQGDDAKANAEWRAVQNTLTSDEGVIHHARALFAIAEQKHDEAREALVAAQLVNYTDMRWLAEDPRLAALLEDPPPSDP